jgi:hypothetical protein
MSDRNVHPKTRAMHNDWRLRAIRRRDTKNIRRSSLENGVRAATVVATSPNGDVQIDRLSNGDDGQWLTPVNGRTPAVGSVVAVTEIDGSLAVLGPVGEGVWSIIPDDELIFPAYYLPEELVIGDPDFPDNLPTWNSVESHPFVSIDPMNPRIFMGAPPFVAPNALYWYDHFISGGSASGNIGREGWATSGNGSVTAIGVGHFIRIVSGSTSGNSRIVYLGTDAVQTMFNIGDPFYTIAEAWFAFRVLADTSCVYRLGLGQSFGAATPTDGMYIELDSTGLLMKARIVTTGVDVTQNIGTWMANTPYIVSVRSEPDRTGRPVSSVRLTFTVWGISRDGNLEPNLQWITARDDFGGFFGAPMVGVRTSTAANKQLELDYAAGFVYSSMYPSGLY